MNLSFYSHFLLFHQTFIVILTFFMNLKSWLQQKISTSTFMINLSNLKYFVFQLSSHTHTHIYIYIVISVWYIFLVIIYIYIYIYIYIDTYLVVHYRLYTFFLHIFVNPFELPYWSYDIRQESVDKPSIIRYFPRTFCPTLGHLLWRMYYKSNVTFVCTLLLCKNEHLYCCIV